MARIYLPVYEIIIELHDAILEESGGRPGMHDPNVVRAAIARPKRTLATAKTVASIQFVQFY